MAEAVLKVEGLQAWYGESHVLHGVDMVVQPGEVVTLLGRNGAGRTTTLRAVLGLTGSRKGSIKVNGTETVGLATHRIAHLGIGYCPEERGIFASLSAEENLLLPPALKGMGPGMSLDEIFTVLQANLTNHDVVAQDILVKELRLTPELEAAINDKLIQEQNALKYEFTLKSEEGERQRKVIEAQGIRAFSDISRIDILKWRGLQATEALAKSANAKVVVIGSGTQLPIILGDK